MFERKSMEQVLQRMVDWTRGSTKKLTDFRVGSKTRTLYESVALVVEELYDKVFRAIKITIDENIYTVLGFPKRPATYATGDVTFGRLTPADSNYLISAGTLIRTRATENKPPIEFRTTEDVLLAQGSLSVTASVVCTTPGVIGNVESGSITEFVTKPAGIETVTNASVYTNGLEEETKDEQKVRFQKFIQSLSRGTIPSIEYGAMTTELRDTEGRLLERVSTARAFEYLPTRKGEVDVYIWNGAGTSSGALIAETHKVITGYYHPTTGEPIYGYKPAGILVNVYSAVAKHVTIKLEITPEEGINLEDIKPYIHREVTNYFSKLNLGQTLLQTVLETRVALVYGVYDVKLSLSLDNGTTYTQDNLTAGDTEILTLKDPLIYV